MRTGEIIEVEAEADAAPPAPLRSAYRPAVVVSELLGAVVPVVLVVQVVLLLALELRHASFASTQSLERVNLAADVRARSLGEPLWRLEYDKLRARLQEIALDPNVGAVTVEDDTGTAVAHVAGAASHALTAQIERALEYQNGNMKDKAGRLIISFAATPVLEQLSTHYGSGLFVCALAAFLLCIVTRLSAHVLIGRPLGKIIEAIRRARVEGGRHVALPTCDNEIGALAAAFNELQNEQTHAKAQLEYHATHDELTGLPNRRLLHQRLAVLGQGVARNVALHFLDLDDFKGINDTFGHQAGDQYLAHVACHLKGAAGDNHWVARLGGDEFVVLQEAVVGEAEAQAFAATLLQAIATPVEINGKTIVPRGSIGIAVRRTDDAEVANLLRLADIALYHVKQNRAGSVGVLTAELLRAHRRRKELAAALPVAFEKGQFEAWFQGQFDLHSGRMVGLEALIRWRHPEHGLIPPMEFVPIIEQSGASTALARLVFERLCQARLVLAGEGFADMPLAMNVSPHELTDFSFGEEMVEIARRYDVPLSGFEIEITEGLLINNVAHTHEALARIRKLGVRVALDDFGQGYSSLAYLRRFPLDRLKIDKAFTRDLQDDVTGAAVLGGIVTLAAKLDLEVVVEGVETESQAEVLRGLGVWVGQGFLYHRPQPLADLLAFIRRGGASRDALRAAG